MYRALLFAALAAVLIVTPVYAEDASWHSDPPKQGTAGFSLCTGYAEAGGHSYRNTNYIDNEILANCDRYAREDVSRWFLYRHGITIDPSIVRVTISPAR